MMEPARQRCPAELDEDVHVAVFHDEQHVFGAAQQHGALGPLGAAGRHGLGRGRGAHKADARHARVLIPGAGDVAVAVHHVDHARRQADLHEDLAHELHEIGRLGGRLEDEGIARHDGVGDEPAEDQRREVERRHAAENAQRLPDYLGGDVGGHVVQDVALDHGRRGGGGLDDLDDALHFAARFGNVFGLVKGDAVRQLFGVADHAFTDLEHIGHALAHRQVAPALVGGMGRGDGLFRRFRPGNGHGTDLFTGGRIVQGHALAVDFVLPFAVDEVADPDV